MKIIDPWQQKSKMPKIWKTILFGLIICIIVVIIGGLPILFFGVVGWKNGFFKQTVMTVGTILLFVLSY